MPAVASTGTAIAGIPPTPDLIWTGFRVFGTFGALLVTQQLAVRPALDILGGVLHAIDLACSRFRPDSELTMLNRDSGRRHEISPLLAEALAVALRVAAATNGDVDPTCGQSLVQLGYDRDFAEVLNRQPSVAAAPLPAGGWQRLELDQDALTVRVPDGVQLDLGATAKALAADRSAAAIAARTGTGVLVNLGGDIAVDGPVPRTGWRIEIDTAHGADACPPARTEPVVAIWDGGLATSSTGSRAWSNGGQRVHHILDPRTGRPADSCWAAASVAAASCVDANAASTAAIIRSAEAPGWLDSLGLPARLVSTTGAVVTTGAWPHEP